MAENASLLISLSFATFRSVRLTTNREFLYSEDGGSSCQRNVSTYLPNYIITRRYIPEERNLDTTLRILNLTMLNFLFSSLWKLHFSAMSKDIKFDIVKLRNFFLVETSFFCNVKGNSFISYLAEH